MKNLLVALGFCLMFSSVSFTQTGKVFDKLSHTSKILKGDRNFAVYLPPDYETSQRDYPVLYLLHGAGDDQTGWVQFGEVLHITDKAIKEGKATPMIIVMPDAYTNRMGYFNDMRGDWNYEDYFFEEFMPYVEKNYRIKSEKRYRAVAGLSMGGGGSFMYALRHPELFSSACPLSAYAGPKSVDEVKNMAKRYYNFEASDVEAQKYLSNYSALSLIETMTKKEIESVKWYIDCGDDDFLYEGNSLVHIALRKKKVHHEFRIRNGGHTWTYWRESLPEVLEFVSNTFHQK
ncbi:alpha/beta hydrolase-fold protein [Flavivirga abyssicola]|uniref:alpha/beta hydrolase n=1 Tax=Flavivirga abyssicola TaxID=3063533 RepID=UPI0026E112C8|nr:alpha/beta hydrolase-fold protein [Flavivirga sp. MEBiC07777]WVK11572.1 alpha/beta hydrolase-fold protein [Flavivirga sp. MEBiC07777]